MKTRPRWLDGLREQARSLSVFAEDVLSIAQAENEHFSPSTVAVDMGALVEGARSHA